MNQLPYWIQLLQALATPAFALLAAVIGWAQWQTNRQKFLLDLFEKRFSVFMDIRKIASEAIQLGALADKGLPNEVFAKGRFLFDREITKKLDELYKLTIDLELKRPSASVEISKLYDEMCNLFEPYLRMPQKNSNWW